MIARNDISIDEEIIRRLGLHVSDKLSEAHIAPNARVFESPYLENVFIMECDLYGNLMPEGSCFLAFYGRHGYQGKQLKIETLKNASVDDLKKIVERNLEA